MGHRLTRLQHMCLTTLKILIIANDMLALHLKPYIIILINHKPRCSRAGFYNFLKVCDT